MSIWNPYQSGTSYSPNGTPVPLWLAPGQSNHYGRTYQPWTQIVTTDNTGQMWTVGQPQPSHVHRVYPSVWHFPTDPAPAVAVPDDEDRRLAVMHPLGAE